MFKRGQSTGSSGRASRSTYPFEGPKLHSVPIALRPYQREAIAAVLAARREGVRRLLVHRVTVGVGG